MENEINNQYIENAIVQLEKTIGIKEPISGETIYSLLKTGKIKEAMKLIALQFGLPVDFNIIYVSNDWQEQSNDNRFHSKNLVKKDKPNSSGGGITAQVIIPSNLPFYGSPTLTGFPITIKISQNCAQRPESFTLIMAHELSHVLLYSLSYIEKDNEFYTDLTAIISGFKTIFKTGRKITDTEYSSDLFSNSTKTTTTTYGYLSDKQFDFACRKLNAMLEKNREKKKLLSNELNKFIKSLSTYEKDLFKFKRYLKHHTKHIDRKISTNDSEGMMRFFQPGFTEELSFPIQEYKPRQKTIETFLNNLSHYSDRSLNQVSIYIEEIKKNITSLQPTIYSLRENLKIIDKYVDVIFKINTFLFITFNWSKK